VELPRSGDLETASLHVEPRCPHCGRFLVMRSGRVSVNALGRVTLSGFRCHRCGEVKPDYEWSA